MAMATATAPTFTAAYAKKRAWRNVVRLFGAEAMKPVPCGHCKGSREITLLVSTLGGSAEEAKEKESKIPCISCKDGTTSAGLNAFNKLIWCGCKHKSDVAGFLFARDGRAVFGNDTYLCRHCGFVRQFG